MSKVSLFVLVVLVLCVTENLCNDVKDWFDEAGRKTGKAFKDAWNWLKKKFTIRSSTAPSRIGPTEGSAARIGMADDLVVLPAEWEELEEWKNTKFSFGGNGTRNRVDKELNLTEPNNIWNISWKIH